MRASPSLAWRLSLGAAAVLTAFVALTAIGLEQAFGDHARAARQELLLAQVYRLMAAAEVGDSGQLEFPGGVPEPRLAQNGSSLYAAILDAQGAVVWRSPSAQGATLPVLAALPPGASDFGKVDTTAGSLFLQRFGVRWTTGSGSHPFTFAVAEDMSAFEAQRQSYRRTLWGWLGVTALLLLALQAAVLRWGLRPLRQVSADLLRLQSGEADRLDGAHPREIQGLVDPLNQLITHERRQRTRHREALADLAHSLKTPLALVRAELGDTAVDPGLKTRLDTHIERMSRSVDYHLQRATATGPRPLTAPLALAESSRRLAQALQKMHADKVVGCDIDIPADLQARIDPGDFSELLGNLLDNAFKWCRCQVRVAAVALPEGALALEVDDDGPGFDASIGPQVLERGVRADEQVPGHGIGLAVVRDIVVGLGGRIDLGRSRLGGARVQIVLPGLVARGPHHAPATDPARQ